MVFCFLQLSLPVAIAGGTAGTWEVTGSMNGYREYSTATLMPNGMVLIVGGNYSLTAELYNPDTGLFSTTGSMLQARYLHTATILPNGMVLIVGGNSSLTAELYDP